MEIKMPMILGGKTGKVGKINVKSGDQVRKEDTLVQVEIGKGNRPIKAPQDGRIEKVVCKEGDTLASDSVLFILESDISIQELHETSEPKEEILETLETELLIIGAGPGGYVAAIYAAKHGKKVSIVEKEELGGTCLNVGCIPTKALVKSSEICEGIKHAPVFGINIRNEISVEMDKVLERKEEIRTTLVDGISYLMKKNQVTVKKGNASFEDNNTVLVTGETRVRIHAEDIIVATGSKISKIGIEGIDLPFVLNSTTALSNPKLPTSITIIGGGVIGMEFAFMYKNFGVDVHVIEFMDRLLTMLDSEVSKEIYHSARKRGIKVHLSSKVTKIQKSQDNQAVVHYEDKEGEKLTVSENVLVAIGREPELESLHPEKAGLLLNERGRGIKVDSFLRTNVEHIYAIGDVTNRIQLAHVASHQAMVAVDNILLKQVEMDYQAIPNVIFTSPEIASVGKTEEACREENLDYKVSKFDFAGNGKALTMNETEGFVKLIEDNTTNRIIGASIIGADASSLISTLTFAIQNECGKEELIHTVFAHPTTGEVIHEAALGLDIGAIHQ